MVESQELGELRVLVLLTSQAGGQTLHHSARHRFRPVRYQPLSHGRRSFEGLRAGLQRQLCGGGGTLGGGGAHGASGEIVYRFSVGWRVLLYLV